MGTLNLQHSAKALPQARQTQMVDGRYFCNLFARNQFLMLHFTMDCSVLKVWHNGAWVKRTVNVLVAVNYSMVTGRNPIFFMKLGVVVQSYISVTREREPLAIFRCNF